MTFWTETMNPPVRTWQCFVCGGKLETYGDYAEHIIKEHDEGRDYVKCPVDTCGAPVRDLKTHFKVKHPKRDMPKNCQLKATIWRDFSPNGNKKPKTRKPTFKEGWFESLKNSGAKMYYRSGYEADVYQCLEDDNDVKAFQPEPFKVPYYFQNEWHNYIPDIKITYQDGTTEIWEIKPATQTGYEKNKAKWKAMNEYADKLGWNFTVVTEKGISTLKKKVRDQGKTT